MMTTETGLKSQRESGLSMYLTYAGTPPLEKPTQGQPGLDT